MHERRHLDIALLTASASVAEDVAAALAGAGHRLAAVVAPAGEGFAQRTRALVEAPPAEAEVVLAHRLELGETLGRLAPELVVCRLFPWRVPADALARAPLGAVNGHPSLLPRHRGPLPLAWTLRSGDRVLGYSYHRMTLAFDAGAVLAQDEAPLGEDDGPGEIAAKVNVLARRLLSEALARAADGDPGWPQDEDAATYAPRFEPAYAHVDWAEPAAAVHRRVRAWWFAGPGPTAVVGDERLRLLRTRVEPAAGGSPGEVLEAGADGLLVRCGEDAIRVLEHEAVGPAEADY